jgi:hypothetical protein
LESSQNARNKRQRRIAVLQKIINGIANLGLTICVCGLLSALFFACDNNRARIERAARDYSRALPIYNPNAARQVFIFAMIIGAFSAPIKLVAHVLSFRTEGYEDIESG